MLALPVCALPVAAAAPLARVLPVVRGWPERGTGTPSRPRQAGGRYPYATIDRGQWLPPVDRRCGLLCAFRPAPPFFQGLRHDTGAAFALGDGVQRGRGYRPDAAPSFAHACPPRVKGFPRGTCPGPTPNTGRGFSQVFYRDRVALCVHFLSQPRPRVLLQAILERNVD